MDFLDLFSFIEEKIASETVSLCSHRSYVGKNGDGWTFEADESSRWFGHWVDSNPNCRRPAFVKDEDGMLHFGTYPSPNPQPQPCPNGFE